MDDFGQYNNPAGNRLNEQPGIDTFSFEFTKESSYIHDSVPLSPIDSTLLTPSDTTFRFYDIQPEEKIFIGDSRYLPDTAYVEKIMWKGLNMSPREKSQFEGDWLTGIMFLSLILLASVRGGYAKYISVLFQSLFNYSTAFRMFREKNYSILHGAIRLELLFYMVLSIFILQVFVEVSTDSSVLSLRWYSLILAAVVSYFLLKKLAYYSLGSIFTSATDTKEFLFNMDNFNRVTGIILFPVVALIAYLPFENPLVAVFLGALTIIAFYLMLIKRAVSILLKKQFPIFYLFLYLCTLEILPLLLIYKIVVD